MHPARLSRRITFASIFVVAVVMVSNLSADELSDGTITIPRSGKEIVSLPSPEAAELCKHIDHAIDYSTGCASLNFPLFTYDQGGISISLSISYRTGGIKADSEPGALGVGWELNFGGYVSRSVVGMPDDAPGVEFSSSTTTLEFLKKQHGNTADAMYDRYSFSAGGYAGSFIICNGRITCLTPTDVRIERTASGFDITTPEGTIYRYDVPEILTYKYQPASYSNAYNSPNYTCECMWRLSKIESPSRQESVIFTYETVPDLKKQSSQTTIASSWASTHRTAVWSDNNPATLQSTAVHTYSKRHRIASISGRGATVSFTYDTSNRERCKGMTVRNHFGQTVRQVSFGSGRTLSSYRITDSASNMLDGADFTYFPAMGSDSETDFFGYRNGGGSKSSVSYNPDSLSINNNPYKSALDKLLRPSWKRQPVLGYTHSESLHTISTVAGTRTEFEYELNEGGYFLAYGRISPGIRLKKETVRDHNTGNERVRTLTYSAPVPSVDFSALRETDFISVSGTYSGSSASTYTNYSTGATISASCRLQGASPENACVYYGKVTETITGFGIAANAPIVTDYEYDTANACSRLSTHNNRWSATDLRVAGARTPSDRIFKQSNDPTPGEIYEMMLAANTVRGYFTEIIGDRAPLKRVTHWRTLPSGSRSVWRQTEYHNSRSTSSQTMGVYSEAVIRMRGGLTAPDIYAVENYDFKYVTDFNHFDIEATTVRVYVDSITDTEYDELGTAHTVIRRMGYNNHRLKWYTGWKTINHFIGPDNKPLTMLSYLQAPKIDGTRSANNSLPSTCIIGCGDEWVRTDYVYSSTSDTPQMRQLDTGGLLSLPVETYYTTGHGFEYDSTAVSEKFTYTTGVGAYDMLLSSDVIRSKSGAEWFVLDSIAVGAYDRYGNPLLVSRNGGTPSYYTWSNNGTTLATATTAGQKTSYAWTPLVGCTSVKSPSGLISAYSYSGSRLSTVTVGGSRIKSYTYSVYGTSSGSSGSSTCNYVNEETVIDASKSVNTRSYFDGFGNRTGAVTADKAWNSAIATLDVYDAAGRLTRSYTPRPAATPYDVSSTASPSGDAVSYSTITYSGCGDSRPLSSTIAGEEYSGHPSRSRHLFNRGHSGGVESALSCRHYRPGASSGSVTLAGYYPEGSLSVEESTDGDGRRALTFTDFRGRLILTRSLLDSGNDLGPVKPDRRIDTYNVYDDAGNMVFVVTPSAAADMATVGSSWSVNDGDTSPGGQCFSYRYDNRMRLRSKKSPGAAEVKYWYDATGVQVLSQDGRLRSAGKCFFALNDSSGRPAVSGECVFSDALAAEVEGRHVVATRSTAKGNLNGYMPGISIDSPDILTSLYYDDYSFMSLSIFSRLSRKIGSRTMPSHKTLPVGLPTAKWTKVLAATSIILLPYTPSPLLALPPAEGFTADQTDSIYIANNGLLDSTSSALYYDTRDRLIASASADHTGGLCLDAYTYNDGGMPITKRFTRWPLSTRDEVEDHSYTYDYDGLGRLSSLTLTRGDSVYNVSSNTYDNIGRLSRSTRGNGCGISYTYKTAGALSSVTAANAAGNTTFSQSLQYATGNTPSYSGNVGSIDWQGDDKVCRRYGFSYDGAARLVSAAYSEPAGRPSSCPASGQCSYSTSYTYGPDSRPLSVRRRGVRTIAFSNDIAVPNFGEVDNLTFSYKGTRLTKIYDAAENIVYTGAADFNDGADEATEYTYDEDGRLTSDANKGITSIRYNSIGLPSEIKFSDGTSVLNCYSADGALLQRAHKEPLQIAIPMANIPIIVTPIRQRYKKITEDHVGPLTFTANSQTYAATVRRPSRIDTPEGFISSDRMHYYVKDDQGNVRQVTDADGAVVQDNHYYPYGMLMGESSNIIADARGYCDLSFNPYLYGSKEYITTAGANILDFTARIYDPSTLLFQTQDPLLYKFHPFNAYSYCGGDPVNRVDPDGRELIIVNEETDEGYHIKMRITGVVYNASSKDYDLTKIVQLIENQLKDVFTFSTDDIKVSMSANIRVSNSSKDISYTDHVFAIVNQDVLKKHSLGHTNNNGIELGTKLIEQTLNGYNTRTIAHEVGHSMGLKDVNLNKNALPVKHMELNLMTQIGALDKETDKNSAILLERVQILNIVDNYNRGYLNRFGQIQLKYCFPSIYKLPFIKK